MNRRIIKKENDAPMILKADDILKGDRWDTPKVFLDRLKAEKGDLLAFEKIGKKTYYVYVLDPKLFKELKISLDEKQSDEILKELMASIQDNEDIECDHIIQVKSQGRCGQKSSITNIMEGIGVGNEDWLYLKFVKNHEEQRCGWIFSALKKTDIKNIVEIEEELEDEG